jgi:hypothetical protein
MVLESSEVSVRLHHPGFDVDLEVIVDTSALYRVYLGRAELGGAIRAGELTVSGPRTLQCGFRHWFTWSAFAPASRSAQERRTAASRLISLLSGRPGHRPTAAVRPTQQPGSDFNRRNGGPFSTGLDSFLAIGSGSVGRGRAV